MTDDKSLPKGERKRLQIERAHSKSEGAKLVKLADKIANLRDMAVAPPATWDGQRLADYFDFAHAVAGGLRGLNSRLDAAFVAAYDARPAVSA